MRLHKRILVLTTNHVGNNLFCTVGTRLLKHHLPDARIDVVTMSRRGASAFAHNPDVHTVYCLPSKTLVRRLARRYDLVIGLHHDVARPYLEGLGAQAVLLAPPTPDRHRTEAMLQSVAAVLGVAVTDADRQYRLCPQPEDVAAIDRRLAIDGQPHTFIGLHLGSGRTAVHGWKFWYAKRDLDPRIWPLERYVALARLLQAADPALRLVITGSRNERFLGRRFTQQVPEAINLVGKTSLLELAALMKRLAVFVTHDNGALHVACATGARLVGLFGPTDPDRTGPYPPGPQNTIIKQARIEDIRAEDVCAAVLTHMRTAQVVAAPLAP